MVPFPLNDDKMIEDTQFSGTIVGNLMLNASAKIKQLTDECTQLKEELVVAHTQIEGCHATITDYITLIGKRDAKIEEQQYALCEKDDKIRGLYDRMDTTRT